MEKCKYYNINEVNDEEEFEVRYEKRKAKEENNKRLAIHKQIKKDLLVMLPAFINRNKLEIIATANRVLVIYISDEYHGDIMNAVNHLLTDKYWDYTRYTYKEDEFHIHISIKLKWETI